MPAGVSPPGIFFHDVNLLKAMTKESKFLKTEKRVRLVEADTDRELKRIFEPGRE